MARRARARRGRRLRGVLALALALVAACDKADTFAAWAAGSGEVYYCDVPDFADVELCTELSELELEARLPPATDCYPTPRAWPRIVGCVYRCTGQAGCNATSGCYPCD